MATREHSAGGVVVREVGGRLSIAVIKPRGRPTTALPKGHIDPGENAEQAATREVLEETGLIARLERKITDIQYVYRFRGRVIFKVVSFFLFRYESGTIDDISQEMRVEVDLASWLPLDEAVSRLSYPGERDVAVQALKILIPPRND